VLQAHGHAGVRRYAGMTDRRGRSSSHVRPRPPSSGRPRQVRAPAPATQRVRAHRGIEGRRRHLPLPARALLGLSVVALGAAVFLTATGGIGALVASVGTSLEAALGRLVATSQPSASEVIATDSPIIALPDKPFTNLDTATLHVTVPVAVINTDATVRVYVALQGLAPSPVEDVPVGSTTQVAADVQLTKGANNFTATIVKDGAESAESAVVTITLDQDPPKVTIASPKNNATVNDSKVTITGTTQAGSSLIAQNATNRTSVTGTAGTDGKFSLILPLGQGSNAITLRVTDPAGNETDQTLTIKQGNGEMAANLSASLYTIHVSHPPSSLQLRVTVTDPNGQPLAGATCTFTLQIPGLAPITSTKTTDASGRASFTTTLVGPMTVGSGLAVVLVTDPDYGQTSDRVPMTFVK
jgi:Glucodextranase, domain B/Bacterial Ig-like domain (group 1)